MPHTASHLGARPCREPFARSSRAGLEASPARAEHHRNGNDGRRQMYALMGLAHAGLVRTGRALGRERGQGTVEYVALILLVALVMAGVVAAMKGFKTNDGKELGDLIIAKIKEAVRKVEF
jgi:hypothetical protein